MTRRKTTRRDFLGQVSGGMAAFLTLPAVTVRQALKAGEQAPSERIRLGFVGVANQGRNNLKALMANAVAVCDVDAKHLADAKNQAEKGTSQSIAAYKDYRKLLEDKNVDGIVVTTPDHWHALITIHACQAGKDVYCEKPLTLTVAEGRSIVQAARKYERIVQTGSQQRSDAKFRLACELVRSGRLGKIQTVKVGLPGVNFKGPAVADATPPAELDYDFWLGPAPQRPYNEKRVHYLFRFFWDYSGGQLTNWGAHHLDITQWGLGMDESGPVAIEGKGRYHKDNWFETPEWFDITYRYANGVVVRCGRDLRGGVTFEGEKGSIFVTRGKLESTPPDIIKQALKESDVHLYASDNHHRNWLECMRSRKLPICDAEIGHRSATVCHLGNIAIRTGRKLAWDPIKETITGDPEAAKMLSYTYRVPYRV